ncbi:FimV family protein [Nitrosovibrio sp. Nv17]|uniref:type IV pilus assembly protein FimV n=1 Tax=Nitrosovibrio sp. Nv17 TaxID=1855339 RepID=UPI0009086D3F|nr:hypothetical protein [Nitrosovibrio sp. Nv17]SFW26312.1 pilus assembly protein FimV [Nitrosovibrio sp. Nv17]
MDGLPKVAPSGFAARACLCLLALLFPALVPALAHAAGLGRLTVHSTLGQSFAAEIDLIAVRRGAIPSLAVRIASQEVFRQANIDYLPLLSTFEITLEQRPDGAPYVRIVSRQPVAEPLLNLLVELDDAGGRVMRAYTVVLAPPAAHPRSPAAPAPQSSPPAGRMESDPLHALSGALRRVLWP